MKEETLLSVGLDIGTTTTQLVFSRLTVKNAASDFSVPDYSIAETEILYRSAIHFTPLLSETQLDASALRELVAGEYARSGFAREQIQTGAVIITGETARKENAGEVLSALSGFAGDFVVATAGPALESILAGKGSGAQKLSREGKCAVCNLDIGGGTTNCALFFCGKLLGTGCLNIGGRLVKLDAAGSVSYVSPVLRAHTRLRVGDRPEMSVLEETAAFLAGLLRTALAGGTLPAEFVVEPLPEIPEDCLLSFSGGVADLICEDAPEPLAYGDLGVLLGQSIYRSELCKGRFRRAHETIRATVIGAGSHTTELSGSTVFYRDVQFPFQNLPVARLEASEEALPPEALGARIREKLALFSPQERAVLSLRGSRSPKFSELCKLADGLALGFAGSGDAPEPVVIAVEEDMGKALGQALHMLLPERGLVCLDGISLPEGSYLDIGAPIAQGQVLPVVVKTLALG